MYKCDANACAMKLAAAAGPQLEVELKYELSRKEYQKLLSVVRDSIFRETDYRSYYFDTKKGALKKAGLNIRLRIDDDRAVLTVKSQASVQIKDRLPVKARWELDKTLALERAEAIADGSVPFGSLRLDVIQKLREQFDGDLDKVKILGSIPSHRTVARLDDGTEIEVDRFTIAGDELYEVEIEFAQGAEKAIHKKMKRFFEANGIRWKFSPSSKRSRLLESLGLK